MFGRGPISMLITFGGGIQAPEFRLFKSFDRPQNRYHSLALFASEAMNGSRVALDLVGVCIEVKASV